MGRQRNWVLPRTRVGRVGAAVATATFVWALWGGPNELGQIIALAAAVAVVWTAVVRHGDASLLLWVLGLGAVCGVVYSIVW